MVVNFSFESKSKGVAQEGHKEGCDSRVVIGTFGVWALRMARFEIRPSPDVFHQRGSVVRR